MTVARECSADLCSAPALPRPTLPCPALELDPLKVRHARLIRAFGAAEGTLLLVLVEQYRQGGAGPGSWIRLSSARWIQGAAALSGGAVPFASAQLRHHLSHLTRAGVIERRYLRRYGTFEFRLNRDVLQQKLKEAQTDGEGRK
ncbi:hypothetical protein [Deinococcus sp. SL84]|uniref:hypothetical protein n=1 Tax=Deinococcus sp. SL84 TaxID=2994663 RepID=UPI0022725FBE|nr:hypothetical protein [Deinococcus sp. SL84]MCY1703963.1 hypothetical protein [Deinococcus sp. SL84]